MLILNERSNLIMEKNKLTLAEIILRDKLLSE